MEVGRCNGDVIDYEVKADEFECLEWCGDRGWFTFHVTSGGCTILEDCPDFDPDLTEYVSGEGSCGSQGKKNAFISKNRI